MGINASDGTKRVVQTAAKTIYSPLWEHTFIAILAASLSPPLTAQKRRLNSINAQDSTERAIYERVQGRI